jgi:hypothetical protein
MEFLSPLNIPKRSGVPVSSVPTIQFWCKDSLVLNQVYHFVDYIWSLFSHVFY